MLFRFCSKVHATFQQCENFDNRLRFNKESLKVGSFLRYSVDGYEDELRIGSIDYNLRYAVQMTVFIATSARCLF